MSSRRCAFKRSAPRFGWPWRQTEGLLNAMLARMGLSDGVGIIERLTADGGYDRLEVYEAASRVGAKVVIPPIGPNEHSGGG